MAHGPEPLELALRALNRRERSVAELSGWLAERGVEGNELEALVAELTESGALDDERFAFAFAEDRRELSGWGAERIRAGLAERGIAPELIERAVAVDGGRAGEVERAAALLERRGEALDDDGARSRALGFLTRRGYEYEIAYEAIRRHGRSAGDQPLADAA